MPQQLSFEELFDPEFLQALRQFTLRVRRVAPSGRLAENKSKDRGIGLEFTDFKPYAPGDDLRAVDWNIYQRLGKIFVRVFEEQQDLPFYVLVDRSSSMYLEEPPRINAALRTALALTSIALHQSDSVGVFSFSNDLQAHVRSTSGKARLMTVARQLAALSERSETQLSSSLQQFNIYKIRLGLLILISDFFEPNGLAGVIEALRHCRHRLLLVQLTRQSDATPNLRTDLQGDVRLTDCETDISVDLTVEPAVLARYREIYREFNSTLESFANAQPAGLIRLDVEQPVINQLGALFEMQTLPV